jgi:hypothetical protein
MLYEGVEFFLSLSLSLLMSYIYGAPCKARNFNVVYIWTYVWQRRKLFISICCTMFQHRINTESYPVAQLYINTLLATKVTLITDGIYFGTLRVNTFQFDPDMFRDTIAILRGS